MTTTAGGGQGTIARVLEQSIERTERKHLAKGPG
jgi:hypothetical protein